MKSINKKAVMTLSAFMVLIFHFWINVTKTAMAETFLKAVCYIGVDMFFFVSAFSIGTRPITDAKKFWISRFKYVYVKFAFWAVVALFVKNWTAGTFFKTITGISLFEKGGGSFLWFLPAILIFYLLLFGYQKLEQKVIKPLKWCLPVCLLVVWTAVALVVMAFTEYRSMFIFWCRIPVLMLGYYAPRLMNSEFVKKLSNKQWIITNAVAGVILLAIGHPIIYKWGFLERLQQPIYNLYYVISIPTLLGLILLVGLLPENRFANVVGSATLEIYAVQMVFGNKFVKLWMDVTGRNMLLTNILTILVITVIALLTSYIYNELICRKLPEAIKKKNATSKM